METIPIITSIDTLNQYSTPLHWLSISGNNSLRALKRFAQLVNMLGTFFAHL